MIPTKWTIGSSIALAILVLPFIFVNFVKPEWAGRFLGIWWFWSVAMTALFWGVLDKRIELLYTDSLLYKKYGRKKVDFIVRIVGFCLGLLLIYFIILPLAKDTQFLLQQKYPLQEDGVIVRTDQSPWGLGGILFQELVFDDRVAREDNSFNINFHYPPFRMGNNVYKFLYIPNTMIILEIHEISK